MWGALAALAGCVLAATPAGRGAGGPGPTMAKTEIQKALQAQGFSPSRWELEESGFDAAGAPEEALAAVAAYLITDKKARPKPDVPAPKARPVVVVGDGVRVGPSPELFGTLLDAVGYFARPAAFPDALLIEIHDFALDGHADFDLRAETVAREEGALVVRGRATLGGPLKTEVYAFETRARKGHPVTFEARYEGPSFE